MITYFQVYMTSVIVTSRAHGKIIVNLYNFQNVWIHKCEFMDCLLMFIYSFLRKHILFFYCHLPLKDNHAMLVPGSLSMSLF